MTLSPRYVGKDNVQGNEEPRLSEEIEIYFPELFRRIEIQEQL